MDRRLSYGRNVIKSYTSRIAPFERVIDLGAGSGQDLALAKEASPGTTRYAVESYPPNVEKLRGQGIRVTGLNLERDRLEFDDEFFDLVMANQIFEHLKEVFWVLHEISRTLKVGGHFILGVPNLASLHNRLMLAVGKQPTCIQNHSAHVRGYTKHDLRRLFDMCFPGGYLLKACEGANYYPFPAAIAKPLARVFPNSAVSIFLLLEKKKSYAGEFLEHPVNARLETNFFLGEKSDEFGHQM